LRHNCNFCSYKSKNISNLLQHQRNVHEKVKHHCGFCDYEAGSSTSLNQHKRSHHEGVKYNCVKCDFQGRYPTHLKRHEKAIHEAKIKSWLIECVMWGKSWDVISILCWINIFIGEILSWYVGDVHSDFDSSRCISTESPKTS
jgi:hypothetical protein